MKAQQGVLGFGGCGGGSTKGKKTKPKLQQCLLWWTLPGAPAIGYGGAAGGAAGGAGNGAGCCVYSNNTERQNTHTKPLQ